jgi:hypothetical protein
LILLGRGGRGAEAKENQQEGDESFHEAEYTLSATFVISAQSILDSDFS